MPDRVVCGIVADVVTFDPELAVTIFKEDIGAAREDGGSLRECPQCCSSCFVLLCPGRAGSGVAEDAGIGDYAKYALLRALVGSGTLPMRLGVIWYLTDDEQRNGDGRKRAHLSQEGWDDLDPGLLASMRMIEAAAVCQDALNVQMIQTSGILPPRTAYFSEPVPGPHGGTRQRLAERSAWFARACATLEGCGLVFLDPDNGLEVPSVRISSPAAARYATVAEVAELLETRVAVVLYQHASRTPWSVQREQVCNRMRSGTSLPLTIRTLRAFSSRAFFCITTTPELAGAIDAGLDQLSRRVTAWPRGRSLHGGITRTLQLKPGCRVFPRHLEESTAPT